MGLGGWGKLEQRSRHRNSTGKGSQIREFTVFWKTQRSVSMSRTSNEGVRAKRWDWRREQGQILYYKALIGHVMEFGPYLNENKKSLSKKWRDQTDTLNGSIRLPRSKQKKLKIWQKGWLTEQNTWESRKRGDLEGTGDGRRREKLVGGQVRVRTEQYQTGSTEVPELALLVQALKWHALEALSKVLTN